MNLGLASATLYPTINYLMVDHLFGDLHPGLQTFVQRLATESRKAFTDPHGMAFMAKLWSCGALTCELEPLPMRLEGSSRIQVWIMSVPRDQQENAQQSDCVFRYDVPIAHLLGRQKVLDYALYQIRFNSDTTSGKCQMSRGYVGITGRHPFTRFKEHRAKALSGKGHILHRTWNWLAQECPGRFHAVFQYIGGAKNLDEAYHFEEQLVAANTLSPKGLNAIPGGYAGIRRLHELRLLDSDGRLLPADRDAALEALEKPHAPGSPCAHYRRGHPRKLPAGKVTWVNPCWVNVKEVQAA